jgi:hypothetical protein
MDQIRFDGLTQSLGAFGSRRAAARTLAGGTLAGLLVHLRPERLTAKKKKRCPRPPRCPASCSFLHHEVDGGDICGTGLAVKQTPCAECTSSRDCNATDSAFPHCVTDFTILSSGERRRIGVCQGYNNGLCSAALACIT